MSDAPQVVAEPPAAPEFRPADGVPPEDASFGELTKRLSDQVKQLAQQEIALAKLELREKGKRVGLGAGMLGGAGVLAFFAFGVLTACAVLALALAVPGWLAALIVAVAYLAIAGALALLGKRSIARATPLAPTETTESVKEDVQLVKEQAREARS